MNGVPVVNERPPDLRLPFPLLRRPRPLDRGGCLCLAEPDLARVQSRPASVALDLNQGSLVD
jgi:hypothetical protein